MPIFAFHIGSKWFSMGGIASAGFASHRSHATRQVLYRTEASMSGMFPRSAPSPSRPRPPQDQVGGPLCNNWIFCSRHHGASSSVSPCEAGVWLNGVLALHPVHHVKVTHLILPCRPNHRCPANKMLVRKFGFHWTWCVHCTGHPHI